MMIGAIGQTAALRPRFRMSLGKQASLHVMKPSGSAPSLPGIEPDIAGATACRFTKTARRSHAAGLRDWRDSGQKPYRHLGCFLLQFRVPIEEGVAVKLGRKVARIVAASMLAVILSGCGGSEEDEEEWQHELELSTTRPNPTVTVGPWVTCVKPPLCNEYLTYDLQAWDDIFFSCQDSSDGRECPSDYTLRCAIEYEDRDDVERRVLYGDGDHISSVRFTRLCHELGGV